MKITTEQFNSLLTKDDLKELEERLVSKDEFAQLLTAVDSLTKNVMDFQAEMASNQVAHNRFEGSIDNLNGRVRKLEVKAI